VSVLSIERFRQQIVAAGHLTEAEMDECLAALSDPATMLTSPLQMSVWGRRLRADRRACQPGIVAQHQC
jgi:hypothetical protein